MLPIGRLLTLVLLIPLPKRLLTDREIVDQGEIDPQIEELFDLAEVIAPEVVDPDTGGLQPSDLLRGRMSQDQLDKLGLRLNRAVDIGIPFPAVSVLALHIADQKVGVARVNRLGFSDIASQKRVPHTPLRGNDIGHLQRYLLSQVPPGLHVNIQPDRLGDHLQRLLERRDLRPGELFPLPRAEIQRPRLIERQIAQFPLAVAGPIDRLIVKEQDLSVFGVIDIQLDHRRLLADRLGEGRNGILRILGLGPAVGAYPPIGEFLTAVLRENRRAEKRGREKSAEVSHCQRSLLLGCVLGSLRGVSGRAPRGCSAPRG